MTFYEITTNQGTQTSTLLGTSAPLADVGGSDTATLAVPALAPGTYKIEAVYGGDANDPGSTSAPVTVTVNLDATETVVTAVPDPLVSGQPATLTATVSVQSPGAGTPTGTVTFLNGSMTLGTGTLRDGQRCGHRHADRDACEAFCPERTASPLTMPSDANDQPSDSANSANSVSTSNSANSAISLAVNYADAFVVLSPTSSPGFGLLVGSSGQVATQTVVSASTSTAVFGQNETLTAKVTGSGAAPTGTVSFLDGSNDLGSGVLTTTGGVTTATLSVPNTGTVALSVGVHPAIEAVYSGDADNLPSSSSLDQITVEQDATQTVVTPSANSRL